MNMFFIKETKRIILGVLVLNLVVHFGSLMAQKQTADSLLEVLTHHGKDNAYRVDLLNALSKALLTENPADSRMYAEKALGISKSLSYRKGIAEANLNIGAWYRRQKNWLLGMRYTIEALSIYEADGDLRMVSYCHRLISHSYTEIDDFEKALPHLRKALSIDQESNYDSGVFADLFTIASTYDRIGDPDSAFYYYQAAMVLSRINNIAVPPHDENYFIAKKALATGDYDVAIGYFLQSIATLEKLGYRQTPGVYYRYIGEAYLKSGRYDRARENLNRSLEIALHFHDRENALKTYQLLKRVEEAQKNFQAAYRFFLLEKELSDSLNRESQSKKMAEIEMAFDLEKKKQEIDRLLQEKRISILWRNILIVGVLLITFFSIVVYRLQRLRMEKTQQLLQAHESLNQKLTEVEKVKSSFYTNLSHEFRTPLTLILAPINDLLKSDIPAKARNTLQLIQRSANRLLDLVNQLLDLTRLETGRMEMILTNGNLHDFISSVAASFDPIAEQNQIQFLKKISVNHPEALWYDEDKLEKILTNLLANAFKFTNPKGKVTLEASIHQDAGTIWLFISVADAGMGISEKDQQYIFMPFYQAGAGQKHSLKGSGLGLSLVKEITKFYGGTIGVESEQGKGSRFTIRLPVLKEAFTQSNLIIAPK